MNQSCTWLTSIPDSRQKLSYLLVSFEDIAAEGVLWHLPSDVAEDLQVLGIVGHIKYSENRRERKI